MFGDDDEPQLAGETAVNNNIIANSPIASSRPSSSITDNSQINITVHPSEGMDEKSLGEKIVKKIEDEKRKQEMNRRAAFGTG